MPAQVDGVCVAALGMEEGSESELMEREFGLVVGQPMEFRFFSSPVRRDDRVGAVVESWDLDEERGYKRYRWDVYDCMAQCQVGLDEATDGDPAALNYCQSECPLTEVVSESIRRGQAEGAFKDFDADLVSHILLASLDGLMFQLLINKNMFDLPAMADALSAAIDRPITVLPEPQVVGALGAALAVMG